MSKRFLLTTAIIPALALAACGESADEGAQGGADPAVEQALNDQIMVDPDLAHQNEGNAALTGGTDQTIPPENMTPEAIQDAKEKAFALMGGSDGQKELPQPKEYGDSIPDAAVYTAAAKAAVQPGGAKCADSVEYSAAWASRLPPIFPVYPRGTTKEAAGTDVGDCSLRVVTFLSPVPLNDVMTFYYSRAVTGGYSVEHAIAAGDNVVSGTKGSASFVAYGRRLSTGATEIDLITNGN